VGSRVECRPRQHFEDDSLVALQLAPDVSWIDGHADDTVFPQPITAPVLNSQRSSTSLAQAVPLRSIERFVVVEVFRREANTLLGIKLGGQGAQPDHANRVRGGVVRGGSEDWRQEFGEKKAANAIHSESQLVALGRLFHRILAHNTCIVEEAMDSCLLG